MGYLALWQYTVCRCFMQSGMNLPAVAAAVAVAVAALRRRRSYVDRCHYKISSACLPACLAASLPPVVLLPAACSGAA